MLVSLYINAVMVASRNYGEAFSVAGTTQHFGSLGGATMFYDGWLYTFDYYEYVIDVTVKSSSCQDLDSDGT